MTGARVSRKNLPLLKRGGTSDERRHRGGFGLTSTLRAAREACHTAKALYLSDWTHHPSPKLRPRVHRSLLLVHTLGLVVACSSQPSRECNVANY